MGLWLRICWLVFLCLPASLHTTQEKFSKFMSTQWRDQVKSQMNVYCLTLALPCQRSQCPRPMGVAKPSCDKAQRDSKPLLFSEWECWVCAENVSGSFLPALCPDVDILKTPLRQRYLLPRLAKSAFLFSCIYQPCCLVYLYAIYPPPCSLNKINALSFPGAAASPSESTVHLITAFLCFRVYTPFPQDLNLGCKHARTWQPN